MKKYYKKIFILLTLLFSLTIKAQVTWEGYVMIKEVHSGDGPYCGLTENGKKVQIILRRIEAPEVHSCFVLKNQPFGIEIRDSIRALIKEKSVYCVCFTKNFNRDVCDVTYQNFKDSTFNDLATLMLKRGWAWRDFKKYKIKIPSDSRFIFDKNYYILAKKLKMGSFIQKKPIRPSVWRKLYKNQGE